MKQFIVHLDCGACHCVLIGGRAGRGCDQIGTELGPQAVPEDLMGYIGLLDDDESDDESFDVVSFEIKSDHLESVQKRCTATFSSFWTMSHVPFSSIPPHPRRVICMVY